VTGMQGSLGGFGLLYLGCWARSFASLQQIIHKQMDRLNG
jgi:hypothetical protein